ncbi:hypothetical protein AMTRI_Chr04g182800 [Amborella trichopoda]
MYYLLERMHQEILTSCTQSSLMILLYRCLKYQSHHWTFPKVDSTHQSYHDSLKIMQKSQIFSTIDIKIIRKIEESLVMKILPMCFIFSNLCFKQFSFYFDVSSLAVAQLCLRLLI